MLPFLMAVLTDYFPKFAGRQMAYVALLAALSVATLVFWVLQHQFTLHVKKPSDTFYGECADAPNASFFRALYFVTTLYTAIGYGDVVPCTSIGKVLTMVFAALGVPLALLCLGKFGKQMTKWSDELLKKISGNDEHTDPSWRLYAVIGLTFVWVFLTSLVLYGMIQAQEGVVDGNYLDAVYFTVITLFTIGFGDYFPRSNSSAVLLFILVIVIGLSLVSMTIALVTRRMESQFDKMVRQMKSIYNETSDNGEDIEANNELISKRFLELLNGQKVAPAESAKNAAAAWKRKSKNRNVGVQTENLDAVESVVSNE